MYTMIVRMSLDPSRLDQVDRHFHDDVVPWAKRGAGFISGRWLRSADGKQGLGIVTYSSQQDAETAATGPLRYAQVEGRAWNIDEVTLFEQVADA
jgi:hypothetical protein